MDNYGRSTNDVNNPPRTEDQQDTQDLAATNLNGQQASTIRPTRNNDEETAAELTADNFDRSARIEEDDDADTNSTFGWIGLALSIVSFFVWPIILGGAGIIMGFISRSRGADTLGNTAIIAGAVSIVISLFILPFV